MTDLRVPAKGRLAVFTGPMFAGKSARLVAAAARHGPAALVLTPAFDTRAGAAVIASREGSRVPALPVSRWPPEAATRSVLLIDEVQFLAAPHYAGDVVEDVMRAVRRGASVIAAGLDTDYRREPFVPVARLLALADERVRLMARCHRCGAPARWTAKKRDTGERLEPGDDELYEARCDAHWQPPG